MIRLRDPVNAKTTRCQGESAPVLSGRVKEAFCFAFDLHAAQVRKGTDIPYISHLMAVASLVLESGGQEDEVIAALLHDAVEDQGGVPTLREIRQRFGERVAGIVAGCTDSDTVPKPPWRTRKERYVAHMMTQASGEVLQVSVCDKLHNIHCTLREYRVTGNGLWDKFSGRRDLIDWYYPALLAAYQARPMPRTLRGFVEELACRVEELQKLVAQLEGGDLKR